MFSYIRHRLSQISQIINGYIFKFKIDWFGLRKIQPLFRNSEADSELIVSLTSYGRRVDKVVFYTLVSLLLQTRKPDRIILWLDEKEWNNNKIPASLKMLQKYGVEINYCEDLKSYKKLVPTINHYPNATIITVDDDCIYRKDIISDLYEAHQKEPYTIICNMATFPKVRDANHMEPYEKWFEESLSPEFIMPVGVCGILYPPNSLYKDVLNKECFQALSPLADDLWFWVMGLLKGSKYKVINQNKIPGSTFDGLYQLLHKGSALTHQNREQQKNDDQIEAIIDYYKIDLSDPDNIKFTDPILSNNDSQLNIKI